MDSHEKLIQKRIKIVKIGAILLIVYGVCALIFFALNTLDIINVFNIVDREASRTVELTTIGTCVMGIITGIFCLLKINLPEWYGILYILSICTVVLNAFMGIGHGTSFGNFAGLIILYVEIIFAATCGTVLYKLKADQTNL